MKCPANSLKYNSCRCITGNFVKKTSRVTELRHKTKKPSATQPPPPPISDLFSIPQADLAQSWHIPRPTLARESQSSHDTSSNTSSHSAKSGSLLLTAVNLAQVQQANTRREPTLSTRNQNIQNYLNHFPINGNVNSHVPELITKKQEPDTVSVASSTHFTVINMHNSRPPKPRSFCRKHQLTILIVSMSILFTIGIMAAVWFLEKRAQQRRMMWS
ncbi:hypothetical protein WA026_006861 [Henosepilachna vigintioctopunctata]|uniref:Uncharacterized protein n=1 Tax=Henosepilachna vigintioctopunctata TaxID=420089 RepID=A0AAW1UH14_9CUCU